MSGALTGHVVPVGQNLCSVNPCGLGFCRYRENSGLALGLEMRVSRQGILPALKIPANWTSIGQVKSWVRINGHEVFFGSVFSNACC